MAKLVHTAEEIIQMIEENGGSPDLAGIEQRDALAFLDKIKDAVDQMVQDLQDELNLTS